MWGAAGDGAAAGTGIALPRQPHGAAGSRGGGRRGLHRLPQRRAGRDGSRAQEKGSRGGGPSMRSLFPPDPRIPASLPPSIAVRRASLAAPSPAQGRVPQSAAGWGARRGGGGDGAGGPRRERGEGRG